MRYRVTLHYNRTSEPEQHDAAGAKQVVEAFVLGQTDARDIEIFDTKLNREISLSEVVLVKDFEE